MLQALQRLDKEERSFQQASLPAVDPVERVHRPRNIHHKTNGDTPVLVVHSAAVQQCRVKQEQNQKQDLSV